MSVDPSASSPYGCFASDGVDFTVSDPATPRAFDNYLWNDALFSCVHQTGVGTCDAQVDGMQAIALFTGVGRVCDIEVFGREHLMSRLIYVRDNATGVFWNVGWEPVCRRPESYACTHGLGQTTIRSRNEGVSSALNIFVPPGNAPVELWRIEIANCSDQSRDLTVFLYNQYALHYKWGFESYGDMIYRGAGYDPELQAMVVEKHPYLAPHRYLTAYMAADRPADGFDGSRDAFVGAYGSLSAPQAVAQGACNNSTGSAESTIGVLQFNLKLEPTASERIEVINGLCDGRGGIRESRSRYFGCFDAQRAALETEKSRMMRHNAIETPDPHFNRLVNGWLKQQTLFGAVWCRWGWMGFRDVVQHGGGVSSFEPQRTRGVLLDALRHQNSDGLALRGWNPVDTKPYSDSMLWLVFSLCAYLKETGDLGLLEERVPYFDVGEGSTLEHVQNALDLLGNETGEHGLCLIRFGDWNDSLTNIGKQGRGESVWLSMAYAYALGLMIELYTHLGRAASAADCARRREAMLATLHDRAWDGKWFLRCFDDEGRPVGSSANAQGRIFANAQSWALLCSAADKAQKTALLDAVDNLLLTPLGYRLVAPPYTERDDNIGRISYLEPGICENGTIYAHGNAFMFLALLREGLGDRAYELFKRITPGYIQGEDDPKRCAAPYVYANCYYAPEHRSRPWLTEFTWITGSVSWFLNAVFDDMLGVRPGYEGLQIAPVLPTAWKETRMERVYRGRRFDVRFRRTGQRSLMLNGRLIEGDLIPLADSLSDNLVEVTR